MIANISVMRKFLREGGKNCTGGNLAGERHGAAQGVLDSAKASRFLSTIHRRRMTYLSECLARLALP